jgi:hypothetical protein
MIARAEQINARPRRVVIAREIRGEIGHQQKADHVRDAGKEMGCGANITISGSVPGEESKRV